ncbi:MAG: cell division protein SepF [Clostridia bacterium]|nr:cell division protein SepF [Clostridia bacterium]
MPSINMGFFGKDQKAKQQTQQPAADTLYNDAADVFDYEEDAISYKSEEGYDAFETQPVQTPVRKKPQPAATGNAVTKIRIMKPKEYGDARSIASKLIEGYIVSMNLENVEDDEEIKNIMTFLAGVVFAIHAEIKRISDQVWLLFPKNHVQLSEDGVEAEEE